MERKLFVPLKMHIYIPLVSFTVNVSQRFLITFHFNLTNDFILYICFHNSKSHATFSHSFQLLSKKFQTFSSFLRDECSNETFSFGLEFDRYVYINYNHITSNPIVRLLFNSLRYHFFLDKLNHCRSKYTVLK